MTSGRGVGALHACSLVIFDLDGTLIDSRQDLAASANRTLASHGLPTRTTEELVSFVGDGARMLVARAAGCPTDAPHLDTLVAAFLTDYEQHAVVQTTLLPGAARLLEELSPRRAVALCTNKPRRATLAVLRGLGVEQRFHVVVCGDDFAERKPSPVPLQQICQGLRLRATDAVMVGDGVQDIHAARAAGITSVGVLGMGSHEELRRAAPDHLIQSLWELSSLLDSTRVTPLR